MERALDVGALERRDLERLERDRVRRLELLELERARDVGGREPLAVLVRLSSAREREQDARERDGW